MSFDTLLETLQHVVAPIVGNFYQDDFAQSLHQSLRSGDKLRLEFDTRNRFDVNAVGVYHYDTHTQLGFLDRISAKKISTLVENFLDANPSCGIWARNELHLIGVVGATHGRVVVIVDQILHRKGSHYG